VQQFRKIKQALAEYADVSQRLDRTFPKRLLDATDLTGIPSEEIIRERYRTQGLARTRLIDSGLLDQSEDIVLPEKHLGDDDRRVLFTYLQDVDEKLLALKPIADKIELMRDILNTKYVGKSLGIERDKGFLVTTSLGAALNPDYLSSGEQHELVLAYRLLFDVDPGSLILIDEPELSLHVSWQQTFLPDLLRISEAADLEFLIATHSPAIIGPRWDLTAELSSTLA
jgi:predicted ATP-binding protein involved in virulence